MCQGTGAASFAPRRSAATLAAATVLWLAACARAAGNPERAPAQSAPRADAPAARGELAPPPAFFEPLAERARALADRPEPLAPTLALPPELEALDYDGYRKIRFRPEHSLWRGQPGRFEVQFFHPGPSYRQPVFISVLEDGREQAVPFTSDWFSYAGLPRAPAARGLEFTGLRVHARLNRDDYADELITFQGASYFRPLGQGNVYGLSARGLAIELGTSRPEEFPRFSRFWLVRPGAADEALWILGLLESRSVTGAYAFRVQPGASTEIQVSARLFVRDAQAALGFAPLSSMYLSGENTPRRSEDFRPEVHDSDGLALWSAAGERLFRPLTNPSRAISSSFRLDAPRGFGLLQRDRDFDHYQDLEARYHDRPSVWVEPRSGFERGSVRLLEIATHSETFDNIAIAWVPDPAAAPPRELELRYRLWVGSQPDAHAPPGQVWATHVLRTQRGVRFLVDFRLPPSAPRAGVEAVVSAAGARLLEQHVEPNPFVQGLRASFELAPEPGRTELELRAFLRARHDTLTETWSYAWRAD